MARKPIKELTYTDSDKIELDEAIAEVERELNLRLECFDRWVSEGRRDYYTARDQVLRLMKAHTVLSQVANSGDMTAAAA